MLARVHTVYFSNTHSKQLYNTPFVKNKPSRTACLAGHMATTAWKFSNSELLCSFSTPATSFVFAVRRRSLVLSQITVNRFLYSYSPLPSQTEICMLPLCPLSPPWTWHHRARAMIDFLISKSWEAFASLAINSNTNVTKRWAHVLPLLLEPSQAVVTCAM
jgi:hypothetical protein